MKTRQKGAELTALLLLACLPGMGASQESDHTPERKPEVHAVKGVVATVSMARGLGPATITLQTSEGTRYTLRLGPVRYLLQKGFNLTVGDVLEVRAAGAGVAPLIAIEARNLTTRKSIRLRDENFRPLWAGGRQAPFRGR